MERKNIGIFFCGIPPEQQSEVAEALNVELGKRGIDAACFITGIGAGASVPEFVQAIISSLERNCIIPAASPDKPVYSDAEEEAIRKRLENLGYL